MDVSVSPIRLHDSFSNYCLVTVFVLEQSTLVWCFAICVGLFAIFLPKNRKSQIFFEIFLCGCRNSLVQHNDFSLLFIIFRKVFKYGISEYLLIRKTILHFDTRSRTIFTVWCEHLPFSYLIYICFIFWVIYDCTYIICFIALE